MTTVFPELLILTLALLRLSFGVISDLITVIVLGIFKSHVLESLNHKEEHQNTLKGRVVVATSARG
jgi:hypothetical protein